jgi:peptidoglycan/LPS O-acetylase OafA/YrhL
MPSQQRVPGLDGLRGLAVALVVAFHVFPGAVPGGFLGVDVFFVLSGYLITGLLARTLTAACAADEPRGEGTAGRARLRGFWWGRARRLLPELATVLVAVSAVAAFAAPEFGAGLRAQVGAAAVSGTNWLLIAHGQDYFAAFSTAAGGPAAPALQHLWSLAVEEQFYVVWPLVLWGLLAASRRIGGARTRRDRRPGLSLLVLAAAAGSFTLMAVHAGTGSSDYYNTLTHCGGLLLGAAVALRLPLQRLSRLERAGAAAVVRPRPSARALATLRAGSLIQSASAEWSGEQAAEPEKAQSGHAAPEQSAAENAEPRRPSARKLALLGRCGVGGLIVLVVLAVCLRGDTTAPERGGILLASVATVPVLLAAATQGTDVARMLTWRPAVYLGVRSYGIYLWHWPLIVLLGAPGSAVGFDARLLRAGTELVLPVVLAGLSRRYVTLPARRLTRAQIVMARDRLLGRAARPWAPRVLAGCAVVALLPALIGLGRAPRVDPDQSALRAQIAAGSAVADAGDAGLGANVAGLGRAPIAVPRSDHLPPAGPPDPVLGQDTTALGDSVLLASAQALADRLPGIVIDAKVGRQAYEAPDQLSELAVEGKLRRYVILALGTNGDLPDGLLDDVRRRIGAERVLVLVTVHVPRSWQDSVNEGLTGYAAVHPGTVLVDWNATVSPYPNLLWDDATHPRPSGAEVYADLVAYDLERAQRAGR